MYFRFTSELRILSKCDNAEGRTGSTMTCKWPPQGKPKRSVSSGVMPYFIYSADSWASSPPVRLFSKSSSTQPPDNDPTKCPLALQASRLPIGRGEEPQVSTTVASQQVSLLCNHWQICSITCLSVACMLSIPSTSSGTSIIRSCTVLLFVYCALLLFVIALHRLLNL